MPTFQFDSVRNWIYRNARPLDLARWKYHFEGGTVREIFKSLAAFQNADGGFGQALEPDAWNPASSPLQTSVAVQLVEEYGGLPKDHLMVIGILQYLASGSDFRDGRWCNVVASNDAYPHAPWWDSSSDSRDRYEYNPSAILVAFALTYADKKSELYHRVKDLAKELTFHYMERPLSEMHPLLCLGFLFHTIEASGLRSERWFAGASEKWVLDVRAAITQDLGRWNGYACLPTTFIKSRLDPLFFDMAKEVDMDLELKNTSLNKDGVWDISWGWTAYPEAFALSENWWKADLAIRNTRLLRDFNYFKIRGFYSPFEE